MEKDVLTRIQESCAESLYDVTPGEQTPVIDVHPKGANNRSEEDGNGADWSDTLYTKPVQGNTAD
jgi:hypothetical protein